MSLENIYIESFGKMKFTLLVIFQMDNGPSGRLNV